MMMWLEAILRFLKVNFCEKKVLGEELYKYLCFRSNPEICFYKLYVP